MLSVGSTAAIAKENDLVSGLESPDHRLRNCRDLHPVFIITKKFLLKLDSRLQTLDDQALSCQFRTHGSSRFGVRGFRRQNLSESRPYSASLPQLCACVRNSNRRG